MPLLVPEEAVTRAQGDWEDLIVALSNFSALQLKWSRVVELALSQDLADTQLL